MDTENHNVTENRTTYAVWIGDRSGSMAGLEKAHSDGYNRFIDEQIKEKTGQFFLTTIRFDNNVEFVNKNVPINSVKKATKETFKARGSTALNDAIGYGINHILKIYEMNNQSSQSNYIIVIMTDGFENSSKEYTDKMIKKMIKDCKMKDISVKFTGANQDAEYTGGKFGLDKTQCITFDATPRGMGILFRSVSDSIKRHRSVGYSEFSKLDKQKNNGYEDDDQNNLNKTMPPPYYLLNNKE